VFDLSYTRNSLMAIDICSNKVSELSISILTQIGVVLNPYKLAN